MKENKSDLISRDALKEELELSKYIIPTDISRLLNSEINRCIEAIDNAPTVTAFTLEDIEGVRAETIKMMKNRYERPQGKWIRKPIRFGTCILQGYECNCGRVVMQRENFCPHCGAEMQKDKNDSL